MHLYLCRDNNIQRYYNWRRGLWIIMATAAYGTLQEFKPEQETITAYLERLTAYFDANSDPNAKRVPVLFSVIGSKAYSVLRSLVAPESPQSKSLDALTKVLKNHYEPKPIVISERYRFHLRNQASNESVGEYITELRRLTSTCERARQKLLTEAKLTLTRAVEFAQCVELAGKKSVSLRGTEANVQKFSHTPRTSRNESRKHNAGQHQQKSCYRCGRTNHDASNCRFREATCHKCKKKGHNAPVCKSSMPRHRHSGTKTQFLTDDADDVDPEEFYLNRLGSNSAKPNSMSREGTWIWSWILARPTPSSQSSRAKHIFPS